MERELKGTWTGRRTKRTRARVVTLIGILPCFRLFTDVINCHIVFLDFQYMQNRIGIHVNIFPNYLLRQNSKSLTGGKADSGIGLRSTMA